MGGHVPVSIGSNALKVFDDRIGNRVGRLARREVTNLVENEPPIPARKITVESFGRGRLVACIHSALDHQCWSRDGFNRRQASLQSIVSRVGCLCLWLPPPSIGV